MNQAKQHKKASPIPVNNFGGESNAGIVIETISFNDLPPLGEWQQPERHDRHSFFLIEKGSVTMEIDFQQHHIPSLHLVYMHPDQVHRILAFKNITVSSWAIDNENLRPEYLELLENLAPAAPLLLNKATFHLIKEAISLCIQLAARENDPQHPLLLKDSCNTLTGLAIAAFLERSAPANNPARFEAITKAFKEILGRHFITLKRPADYARQLNISTHYLNECVKSATGQPVSYHIQQRIILEAKRLLQHSDRSVKEIAADLGYDDYPYFSRLFTKVTGTTAQRFRKKNHD